MVFISLSLISGKNLPIINAASFSVIFFLNLRKSESGIMIKERAMKEKTQTNRINKMSLPFVGSHEKYSIPLIIRYNAIIRESPIRPLWIRRLR